MLGKCWAASAAALIAAIASNASAAAPGDDTKWADHLILNVRFRAEWVDEAGFAADASALTIRTRFGFETPRWRGFAVLAEGADVSHISGDFNDSVNGRMSYPLISDPEATELNRAQISYAGRDEASIAIGRQWLIVDDQRFLGTSGFRQNDQTYDAAKLDTGRRLPISVSYAYIDRVHRPLGDAHPMGAFDSDSHIIEARKETPLGAFAIYGLLLDFDDAPALSSATYGARLTGKRGALGYRVEYARQQEYGVNAADFDLGYLRLAADFTRAWWTLGAGVEMLGGDGASAFQTPLGTLHKFQGWADAFMTTPTNGLRDLHFRGEARWARTPFGAPLTICAEAHDFASEERGDDLGRELDFSASLRVTRRLSVEAAAAFFDGGEAGPADRSKMWLAMMVDF